MIAILAPTAGTCIPVLMIEKVSMRCWFQIYFEYTALMFGRSVLVARIRHSMVWRRLDAVGREFQVMLLRATRGLRLIVRSRLGVHGVVGRGRPLGGDMYLSQLTGIEGSMGILSRTRCRRLATVGRRVCRGR